MSRYIDADALIDDLIHNRSFYPALVASAIKNTPTADVVEVVRCKDCKYCFHYSRPNCERYECEYYGTSDEVVNYVQPTHFCSYGERKEG